MFAQPLIGSGYCRANIIIWDVGRACCQTGNGRFGSAEYHLRGMTVIPPGSYAQHMRKLSEANTAAASALGQMVNRLARSKGIQVINVVRRDAQVQQS